MAAYPPSFPPPSGLNERERARLVREQARAMRDAAQAQRRFLREQSRGLRRRSILGPLLVLVLGIVLLFGRLGHLQLSFALLWYGRWWPLLLVGAGLILLAEWAYDERTAKTAAPGSTPYIRRGLGAGIVLLLILLGIAGSVLRGATRNGVYGFDGLFSDSNGLSEFLGERREQDQTTDIPLPAATELVIDNPHGDIELTGSSSDGQVHIRTHKRIHTNSDADASRKFEMLSPTSQIANGALRLSVASLDGGSADLSISVPPSTASSISANHGEVHVSGLNAALHINSNRGDVEVGTITGPVAVRLNSRNSSLSAHDVQGTLQLDGTGQDITLSDLHGAVSLDGDYYGDTHLEHLSGPVRFHTSRTSVSFSSLTGTFDISPHAELSGTGVNGPVLVDTYSRNVSLDQTKGEVSVADRNGAVTIHTDAPSSAISVANENGSVAVSLPDPPSADVHAESRDGHIESDFALHAASAGGLSTLDGRLGHGGPRIDLKTTNADITLSRAKP